mgnify:CR=1 FL=1
MTSWKPQNLFRDQDDLVKVVQSILIGETNKNDKSDDGDGLDAVQPKAVKKKFKDRKDKDIDNDGDVDDSDKYLHKRRKAVSKAMKESDLDEKRDLTAPPVSAKVVDDADPKSKGFKLVMKFKDGDIEALPFKGLSSIQKLKSIVDKNILNNPKRKSWIPVVSAAMKKDPVKFSKSGFPLRPTPDFFGGKEDVDLEEDVVALDKNGKPVGRYKDLKTAKKLKPDHRYIGKPSMEDVEDNPANKQHLCAKNVVHEEWGEGTCLSEMHDEPDENGDIAWYDVMFEHGIEKQVSIEELKVTKSEGHIHSHHNKKKVKKVKEEDVEEAKSSFRPAVAIKTLKKEFEPLRDKKISMDNAKKLTTIMNKFANDKDMLIQLMKADIPFVSQGAVTRLISKHGMKGAELNKMMKEDVEEVPCAECGKVHEGACAPEDMKEEILDEGKVKYTRNLMKNKSIVDYVKKQQEKNRKKVVKFGNKKVGAFGNEPRFDSGADWLDMASDEVNLSSMSLDKRKAFDAEAEYEAIARKLGLDKFEPKLKEDIVVEAKSVKEDDEDDSDKTDAQKNDMDGDGEKDTKKKKKKKKDDEEEAGKPNKIDTEPEIKTMVSEREMTDSEKNKLDRLKKKFEGGEMHKSMKNEYGDKGDDVFYGKLTKMAMGEEVSLNIDEAKEEGGNENLMMALRKAVSLRGNHPVAFKDGSKVKVSQKDAQNLLNRLQKEKPAAREALMKSAYKSEKHFKMALKGKIDPKKNPLDLD